MSAFEPDIQVVIVTFNCETTITDCVTAITADERVRSLFLVDNASTDATVKRVSPGPPIAEVVTLPENRGFAHAANVGARRCTSPYIAFVNPDAIPEAETLSKLAGVLDRQPDLWAVGPALINDRGGIEHSARSFPTAANALFNWRFLSASSRRPRSLVRFLNLDRKAGEVFQPDWLSGALIVVRRSLFVELGGFDEGYFLYYEDVDLFKRAAAKGQICQYRPDIRAFHAIGHSSASVPIRSGYWRVKAFWRYHRQHLRQNVFDDLAALGYLGCGVFIELLQRLRRLRRTSL